MSDSNSTPSFDRKLEALRFVPEFNGLDEGALRALAQAMTLESYPRATEASAGRSEAGRGFGWWPWRGSDDSRSDPRLIHPYGLDPHDVSLVVVVHGRVRVTQTVDSGDGVSRTREQTLGRGTLTGAQGVVARLESVRPRLHAEVAAEGQVEVLEGHPDQIDPVLQAHGVLRQRIVKSFRAREVGPHVVDVLKRTRELRWVRTDHLFALVEGAPIGLARRDEAIDGLVHGQPPEAICVSLNPDAPRVLGLTELVQGQPSLQDYTATEDFRYLRIPADRFRQLLLEVPDFFRAVRAGSGFEPFRLSGQLGHPEQLGAGVQVVLLLQSSGLKLRFRPIVDLVAEATATHLFDRPFVLHVTAAGRIQRESVKVTVPIRVHDPRDAREVDIVHGWLGVSANDPAAARARIDTEVRRLVQQTNEDRRAYDIVFVDVADLKDGAPAEPDLGLALLGIETATKVAYLHTNEEADRLPAALYEAKAELVPVGLLSPKQEHYALGQLLVDVAQDPGVDADLPFADELVTDLAPPSDRMDRVRSALHRFSRTRRQRFREAFDRARASRRLRSLGELSSSAMKPWPQRTVRVRFDELLVEWLANPDADEASPARLDELVGLHPQLRASFERFARGVTGRRVGLALGGGGAYAYVHATLIEDLVQRGIPIDIISGSSFGTVVGTYFAAGDTDFRRLKDHHFFMTAAMMAGVATSAGMMLAIDADLGRFDLNELDITLLPVATDADSGRERPIRTGTIGYGVRASSSIPPFAPTVDGSSRYLDGSLAANVPVRVLSDEGAGITISSIPIPEAEVRSRPSPASMPRGGPFNRVSDAFRSTMILMRAANSRQAQMADVRYTAQPTGAAMFDFEKRDKIMKDARNDESRRLDNALEQAEQVWWGALNNSPCRIRESEHGDYLDLPMRLYFEVLDDKLWLPAVVETLFDELGEFLRQNADYTTLDILVDEAAVAGDTPCSLEDAAQAGDLVIKALQRAKVASSRIRLTNEIAPRTGMLVDFHFNRNETGKEHLQLEVLRARLVEDGWSLLRKGRTRLARLLALEAARPRMTATGQIDAQVEALLRAVLDQPVRLLHRVRVPERYFWTARYSPDGRWLAAGGGHASMVRIFDAQDPSRSIELPIDDVEPVRALAWSPDGAQLAVTGHMRRRTIRLFDTSSLLKNELSVRLISELAVGNWDVWGVEFSADNARLLGTFMAPQASGFNAAALWTRYDGPSVPLTGHSGRTHRAAFSPDPEAHYIATASEDGRIGLWDGHTGVHLRWLFEGDTPVRTIAWAPWTPNSLTLAAAVGREVIIFRSVTESSPGDPEILRGHQRNVESLIYSSDSRFIATGSKDRTVRLWDLEQGELRTVLSGHEASVSQLAFHPSNEVLATAAGAEVRLWATQTGVLKGKLGGHAAPVSAMDWHPVDGAALMTVASDISTWDPKARGVVVLEASTDNLADVEWDPADPRRAVFTTAESCVGLWNTETGVLTKTLTAAGGQRARAAWHPDGHSLVVALDGAKRLLRLIGRSGEEIQTLEVPNGAFRAVGWSPDGGRLLLQQDGVFTVYTLDATTLRIEHGPIEESSLAFDWSPDGTRLALTQYAVQKNILVWNLAEAYDRERCVRQSPAGFAWSVAWSADGRYLATAHNDGHLLVWDELAPSKNRPHADLVLRDRQTSPGEERHVFKVAFKPVIGSSVLAVVVDRDLYLYDLAQGTEPIAGPHSSHEGEIRHLVWNANGTRLASGATDGSLRLWDEACRRPPVVLKSHQDAVTGLAWRPDGERLLSWADDTTAVVHLVRATDVLHAAGAVSRSNEMSPSEWDEWMKDGGPRRPSWPHFESETKAT